ncbi:putative SEC14-like protein 6 [Artemia franciscana]|uniref:putative SEC14-like protein 6 n=1 Tax=Artemia franciscana TaxID=6661 RepID=UPI0032DADA66
MSLEVVLWIFVYQRIVMSIYFVGLGARNFDLDKAEDMFRKHMDWRRAWRVDELTDDWEPPEILKTYHPMECIGFDKFGRPVWFGRHSQFDIIGAMQCVNTRELLRYFIWIIERRSKNDDETDSKYVTNRAGHELGMKFAQMYEANYPEMLEKAIVINTAPILHILLKIVQPFLSDYTVGRRKVLAKTRIMANNYIAEGQIPVDKGDYNIEFDNSYSYFTSKMVTFSVEVEPIDSDSVFP